MSDLSAARAAPRPSAIVGAQHLAGRLLHAGFLALLLSRAALAFDGVMADAAVQSSKAVLAPHSVTRNAALVTKLSDRSWSVTAGTAVADFFGANGPAEIVQYDWNKTTGAWHDAVLCLVSE